MLPTTQTKLQSVKVNNIVAPPDNLSDEDIIIQIKTGNINAYGSIMRRYNQRIFRIARSIVTDDAAAMDIVQETHIKAFTRIEQFQGSSSFISWLASITRNEALMYLRKHKREVSMPDDEMEFLEKFRGDSLSIKHEELPDTFLENKQLEKLINQYLDILPTSKIPSFYKHIY